MKNKILLSSILLIVLILGLSTITATDTDTTTTTSIEKQTIDTTTSQTIDNKEKVIVNDNKEVKSKIKDTKTEITPKKEIKTKEITTQNQKNKEKIKTTNKTLKKESEINYYVSNDKGSDTNDGTIDKPYKTINQAITQTTKDNTYNIHISTGTYTGVGNTNLTVNGDYKINFIGDGINKTIIDGEVNYTVGKASVWGWDPYFNYYNIYGGNWGMNITKGNGHITLQNMNIQHMLATGGADISLNPYGGVTNYANLSVNNVWFYQNLGGVGASIQNKHNATLTVNNSIFQENRKANTTGNFGPGIYNNGTALVVNSQFIKNAARWGTVTNDAILDIINCTFREGKAYKAASTFKFGSGIAANSGDANYYGTYDVIGLITNIINCTFNDNQQTDIYAGSGNLLINGCNFNHSTGIYMNGYSMDLKNEIYNSIFTDMQPSSLFGSLSVTTGTTFGIFSVTERNTIIKNNTINFTNDGYGLYLKGNTTVINNTLTKYIQINGNNNTIKNNFINTNDIYAVKITGSSQNNNITDNNMYSQVFTGDKTVSANNQNNIIKNNTPLTGIYVNLTEDNFNIYFNNKGVIKNDVVENGSSITITGNITNKNLTFSNIKAFLSCKKTAYIINGSINIINNTSMIINNTNIKNENKVGIVIDSNNNLITYNNINITADKPIEAITLTKDHNTLERNKINIISIANNTGILIKSSKNTLDNNKITLKTDTTIKNTNTIGIALISDNRNKANENTMYSNDIIIDSNMNAIGEQLVNSNNNIIKDFVYIRSSENAKGNELINSKNNQISFSNTPIIANNTAYYIITRGNKTLNKNNTFDGPYSQSITLTANKSIGVFLENATDTYITSTGTIIRYNIIGNYVRGILTKNTENIKIFYVTFNLAKPENTTEQIDHIAIEQINSENTNISAVIMENNTQSVSNIYFNLEDIKYNYEGNFLKLLNTTNTSVKPTEDVSNTTIDIKDIAIIMENSNNNIIDNVSITTQTDYVMNLTNSNNNIITNNYLNSNQFSGGDSTIIQTNSKNNILFNNTPEIIILTDDNYNDYFINQTFIINKTIEITLGSNIYNKNMTFNHAITIKNPKKYTIYNGSMILTDKTGTNNLNNLQFNVTDDRKTIINVMAGNVNLYYSNIIQTNKEKQAQTIYVNNNSTINIVYTNITLNAPEINSDDNSKISTAIYSKDKTNIQYMNINVTSTKTEPNGKIVALTYPNQVLFSTITINSKNNAIGIINDYINKNNILIYSNNFNISNNNITTGILQQQDTFTNTIYTSQIQTNNLTLNSPKTCGIKIINTNVELEDNILITKGKNNTPIYSENSTIIIKKIICISNPNTQNIFKNMISIILTNSNITIENQTKIPLILIENSNNITISYNYLKTEDLQGNYNVKIINSTNITLIQNKPELILTNDNYNVYFTNQTLNSDITAIILGSNLYNKNMTFNHAQISFNNPNNYTIYNGTITFTNNATGSSINKLIINNTDDRESTLIIKANNAKVTYCTIYQENNNPVKTIIIEGTRLVNFNYNNITTNGQNVTILSINKVIAATMLISNRLQGKGTNITALKIFDSTTAQVISVNAFHISLESDNPTVTVQLIKAKGARIQSSEILVKTKNYDTPIIEIINPTSNFVTNNYIESEDVCGNDAVKVIGTGIYTINNNKPTNGNYKTEMNITIPPELKIGKTYPIIINVTSMIGEAVNGTVTVTTNSKETNLTLTDGIATYNYTPTKDGENTIKITYQDPNGKYGKNTLTQTITVNKINAILKVDSVKTTPNTPINIPITLTDEFENPLNGTVTVIDQYNNTFAIINVIDGKGTFTKIFRGNFNQNLTFIYEETETYNAINTTINVDIHKLSTTVTIDPINAHVGDKINLKATVTDEDGHPVTEGSLVFIVNGKTI